MRLVFWPHPPQRSSQGGPGAVTSWAIIDYFLRPKPAYFAVKRELAPITVGIARKEVKTYADSDTAAHYTLSETMEICQSELSPCSSWGSLLTRCR